MRLVGNIALVVLGTLILLVVLARVALSFV
jgi:hypothetical protein